MFNNFFFTDFILQIVKDLMPGAARHLVKKTRSQYRKFEHLLGSTILVSGLSYFLLF